MIKTRRIGYATFETPDLERQIDYYTQIFGLTLTDRDKSRAFPPPVLPSSLLTDQTRAMPSSPLHLANRPWCSSAATMHAA